VVDVAFDYLYDHDNGIKFRKVSQGDVAELMSLKNESWYGTHRVSITNDANIAQWIECLTEEDVNTPKNLILVAAAWIDGEICCIGIFKIFSIDWQNRLAFVGWDGFKEQRSKGYGKKLVKAGVDFCFNVLNLHRLQADILANNGASQACAESAGFIKEGYQKQVVRRNGAWMDNTIWGIITRYTE
jgi:RimJ/RimL family protein N-acetyltransferase